MRSWSSSAPSNDAWSRTTCRFWSRRGRSDSRSDYRRLLELKGEDAEVQYHWGKLCDSIFTSQTVKWVN